jgi:glycosyltransferase involved in cell wall biosynthesis
MTRIRQVVIVVPARDEQTLLPACLDALAVAAGNAPVPVRTIVVLDSCSDGSADVCRRHRVETIEVAFANVGRARHAGVITAVQGGAPTSTLWIANTDADSRVPPDWVAEQVRLADEGADAVLGLVDVDLDVPAVLRAHQAAYLRRVHSNGSHDHVHGASLGIRASTYVDAGGFPPLTDHEDRQLVLRLRAMRSPVVITSTALRVRTSGRTEGRCDEGFARSIASLADAATATSGG